MKEIILTIEEDEVFNGRYMIISQVGNFPKWTCSIEGDNGGTSFSSIEEALKYLPEIKKEIEQSNPDAKVIFNEGTA